MTAHVASSVGWFGALVAFLALSIAALISNDRELVRGAYIVMNALAWYALVPLCAAAFVSGIVQSLGSRWGLFKHYWVVMKLTITVIGTVVLVAYTQTLDYFADDARALSASSSLHTLQSPSPVLHATIGAVLLLGAIILSVYKPKGLTRYGRHKAATTTQ